MKVFAARAYTDYDTDYEKVYIGDIKDHFGVEDIIPLPKIDELHKSSRFGVGLFKKEADFFFPLIDNCDFCTVAPINNEFNKDGSRRTDKGRLSEGVKDEALYALSIGKKVYKFDGGALEAFSLINLRDSEELIKQLILLEKYYHILGNYPKMKDLIKTERRLNIHPLMVNFYFRNSKVRDLIKGFVGMGGKGIKPVTIQYRYPYIRELQHPIRYIPLNFQRKTLRGGSENRLMTINDLAKDFLMKKEGELHFYECIFDEGIKDGSLIDREIEQKLNELFVLNEGESGESKSKREYKGAKFEHNMVYDNHIIGINVVFDIDGPPGANLFDKKWWGDFIGMKEAAVDYFRDDLDMRCLCSTTGNGFNVTGEPYFFKEWNDNFYDFREMIEEDIHTLNDLYRTVISGRIVNKTRESLGVKIDNSPITWSIYKKLVFTYQAKTNRFTLPISKDEIDRKWLEKVSDVDYFLSNEIYNIEQVILRSNWLEDKWW